jgi:hypothetical protein
MQFWFDLNCLFSCQGIQIVMYKVNEVIWPVFVLGEFSHFFNLKKNKKSTHAKDFLKKNCLNFLDFEKIIINSPNSYNKFQLVAKTKKDSSILVINRSIVHWSILNPLMLFYFISLSYFKWPYFGQLQNPILCLENMKSMLKEKFKLAFANY